MPMIAPEDTCVVETGSAQKEAALTNADVVRFASSPSSGDIGVTFVASVSVTRKPPSMLPRPIASATAA